MLFLTQIYCGIIGLDILHILSLLLQLDAHVQCNRAIKIYMPWHRSQVASAFHFSFNSSAVFHGARLQSISNGVYCFTIFLHKSTQKHDVAVLSCHEVGKLIIWGFVVHQ